MHEQDLDLWQHDHSFGHEAKRPGETRTIIVIVVAAVMMVVEIVGGTVFGSMALLADGLHMASHVAALGLAAFAYIYARRHARDERYNFGTGKVNALGGFTGAVLLAVFALMMAWESVMRLVSPVEIAFNHAIVVTVLGLVVNGASMLILGHKHEHAHGAEEGEHPHKDHDDHHGDDHGHGHDGQDHNLQAAYLHVLADALTSVLAIIALLLGKYNGLVWMDPVIGIVGSLLVAKWSVGLLHSTGAVLLDRQGPKWVRDAIKQSIERHESNRIADLHIWSIGANLYAVELVVLTHDPQPPDHYKRQLPKDAGLAHVTVEVHRCCESTSVVDSGS